MISIVVPLYQKEESVIRTLESIERSVRSEYEIIVVNDGSVDGGPALVRAWMEGRNGLVIDQARSGLAKARNIGVAHARYPLVAFLNAGDTWLDNHGERMLRLATEYPQASLYVSAWMEIARDGAPVRPEFGVDTDKTGIVPCYFETMATGERVVTASSGAAWREMLLRSGGFYEHSEVDDDRIGWARLAVLGPVVYSPVVTAAVYGKDLDFERDDPVYLRELKRMYEKSGVPGIRRLYNVERARQMGVIDVYDHTAPDRIEDLIDDHL